MIEVTVNQENLEYFLLILTRIASFMVTAPFFSQNNTPVRTKLGLSIFVSTLLYMMVPLEQAQLNYATVVDYAVLIIKESVVGLLIGFSAFICSTVLQFSGRIIDMEIGLSMAQVLDPVTRAQVGLTGSMYTYAVFFLMLLSNMHLYLLSSVIDSFSLIPIGEIRLGSTMYGTVIKFLSTYIIIGFRVALPVFAAILILNCVLGIMAKVAPQMNMFSVGMQLKVMTGMLVIFITVSLLPSVANFIFDHMQQMVSGVLKGMIG